MGDMTRAEFRDAVRFHLDDKQSLSTAELNRYINMAYIHVAQPHIYQHREFLVETVEVFGGTLENIPFTETTIEDGASFDHLVNGASPTDPGKFLSLISITLIEGSVVATFPLLATASRKPLRPISPWEWEGIQIPSGTVRPSFYTMWDRIIYFDTIPPATDSCLIRWWGEPRVADFNDDAEVTVLPSMWDDTIIVGAVWRGWRALGEFGKASLAKDEFMRLIREGPDYMGVEARHRMARHSVEEFGSMPNSVGSRG